MAITPLNHLGKQRLIRGDNISRTPQQSQATKVNARSYKKQVEVKELITQATWRENVQEAKRRKRRISQVREKVEKANWRK